MYYSKTKLIKQNANEVFSSFSVSPMNEITALFNNMRTNQVKSNQINFNEHSRKGVFSEQYNRIVMFCHQSNVRRLLPASD